MGESLRAHLSFVVGIHLQYPEATFILDRHVPCRHELRVLGAVPREDARRISRLDLEAQHCDSLALRVALSKAREWRSREVTELRGTVAAWL